MVSFMCCVCIKVSEQCIYIPKPDKQLQCWISLRDSQSWKQSQGLYISWGRGAGGGKWQTSREGVRAAEPRTRSDRPLKLLPTLVTSW